MPRQYYYLFPVGKNNHILESECEGHFTSHSQAVEYLRELGGTVFPADKVGAGWRYEIMNSEGARERWAVVRRPLKEGLYGEDEVGDHVGLEERRLSEARMTHRYIMRNY